MPTIGGVEVSGWIPKVGMPAISPLSLWGILIGFLIALVLVFMFRISQYRIRVEILEYVNNGFVRKKFRYKKAYDKDNNMTYLSPMQGSMRIANFPNECFIKVRGMPIVGILRSICLIRINQNSFNVFLPAEGRDEYGEIRPYDTRSWLHAEQLRKVNKKIQKQNILYLLGIIAPSAVIIILVFMLLVGIFLPVVFYQHLLNRAEAITNALMAVKGGG